MIIPTYREIDRDLMQRGFTKRPSKGSHYIYSNGEVTTCLPCKHMGDRPINGLYKHICNQLGFEPGKGYE